VPGLSPALPGLFAASRRKRQLVSLPFLNPATVGGHGNVALYVTGIVLVFFFVG